MKQQWEPPELEEMPMVILSLHQKWWQKMAVGEKFWNCGRQSHNAKHHSGYWCMSQAAWE